MHQSFETPAPRGPRIVGTAGLKCWDLTSDESQQCWRCAGVLISPLKYPWWNSRGFSQVLPGYSTVYLPRLNFWLEPRFCMCVCVQMSSLKPLGQLKPNFMWNFHGIGEQSLFKWFRWGSRSSVVLHYCQPPGLGAFSRDFTINLFPQCRAFSRALKNI